ncbi:unnamed protein product [Mycena citricolor]|uniref:Carboxypeptidase n=1 Tax=Mycena citricolor TaxID=2018698 RepID=A0AAD2Q696_9AGAR|nr:unnamed protein product [Mycena citricolor]
MKMIALLPPLLLALATSVVATANPAAPLKHKFVSKINPEVTLRVVNNSGICETTPGVNQISGYVDIGTGMSVWFWFFEARTAPATAPFTLWINGGPGCASEIENGPCTANSNGRSTTVNPYSWNTVSNMIYIDQPIGTGFSHGTDTVVSTQTAAEQFWQTFQILFESGQFSKYASREFIFATESYGGHYGPAFVSYFNSQNAAISAGTVTGIPIVVSALMINNGWIDPLIQNLAYVSFAANAPGYGALASRSTITQMNNTYYQSGGCLAQQTNCYNAGTGTSSNRICINADNFCGSMFSDAVGNRDPYDLRQDSSEAFPPEYYVNYLQQRSVQTAIGAEVTYQECPNAPYQKFATTGDDARTWLPQLGQLANSTMKILIWAGDADIICNWVGNHDAVLAMNWYGKAKFAAQTFTNMTLNGTPIAAIKNVDNFSFARVYGAGHEVAAFQPAASLELFKQVIAKQPLHSV